MEFNARRYCLNLDNVISCGITTCCTTENYSVLNGFNINGCNYPQLTCTELSNLSTTTFKNRVADFLLYVGLENPLTRDRLIDESEFFDSTYNYCYLNQDFIVYEFFDGIRIIDIGEVLGEAQYKVYPENDNPDNYEWVTNNTFFNLDTNGVYVFEIRDYYQEEEYCKVSKIISLPTLTPSTTIIPQLKTVSLLSESRVENDTRLFDIGCVNISPVLNNNEILSVNLTIEAISVNDASSYAKLILDPYDSTPQTFCCVTNIDAAFTTDITLRTDDILCYEIVSDINEPGSSSEAYVKLNSVGGFGVTDPTIDLSSCCIGVSKSIEKSEHYVVLGPVTCSESSSSCSKKLSLIITPPIPQNESFDLNIDSLITLVGFETGNEDNPSGKLDVYCKPNGSTTYDKILFNNPTKPQPFEGTINIKHSDEICFDLASYVYESGDSASTCLSLKSTNDSNGISTVLVYPITISVSKTLEDKNVTVSVCRNNICTCTSNLEANGFINVSPTLSSSESITVNYDGQVSENPFSFNNVATFCLFCKPSNFATFTSIDTENNDSETSKNFNGSFTFNSGDCICYKIIADRGDTGCVLSCFNISSVVGSSGINAIVSSTKSGDSVVNN